MKWNLGTTNPEITGRYVVTTNMGDFYAFDYEQDLNQWFDEMGNLQDPPTKDDIDKLKSVFTPYGTHKIKEYLINLFLHKFKMNTNHIRLIKN